VFYTKDGGTLDAVISPSSRGFPDFWGLQTLHWTLCSQPASNGEKDPLNDLSGDFRNQTQMGPTALLPMLARMAASTNHPPAKKYVRCMWLSGQSPEPKTAAAAGSSSARR